MSSQQYISNWINKSGPDYFSLFIGTWIPFNAWYMSNYYDEDSSPQRIHDREIIDFLKNNENKFRERIISLLKGSDKTSDEFRIYLAELQSELEAHPIPNADNKLSFASISVADNSKNTDTIQYGCYLYKGSFDSTQNKNSARWKLEILSKAHQKTKKIISLFSSSISELKKDPEYSSSNTIQKQKLEECLNNISRQKRISVVARTINKPKSKRKIRGYILISEDKNLYFCDDTELISKAIIQILYELRCKLFHGEIEPTNTYMGIFKQAFYILRTLIQELA